jgi:hypothetical protein
MECFSMPKGMPNKRYTPEFKVMVVETMHKEGLSYCEAAREFKVSSDTRVLLGKFEKRPDDIVPFGRFSK